MPKQKSPKMKKSIRDRWVKALRSGKYKQATGTLCRDQDTGCESYCCLGVLAKVINDPAGILHWCSLLDTDTLEITGLSSEAQDRLSDLNDSGKWSFKKIAALIERYY